MIGVPFWLKQRLTPETNISPTLITRPLLVIGRAQRSGWRSGLAARLVRVRAAGSDKVQKRSWLPSLVPYPRCTVQLRESRAREWAGWCRVVCPSTSRLVVPHGTLVLSYRGHVVWRHCAVTLVWPGVLGWRPSSLAVASRFPKCSTARLLAIS